MGKKESTCIHNKSTSAIILKPYPSNYRNREVLIHKLFTKHGRSYSIGCVFAARLAPVVGSLFSADKACEYTCWVFATSGSAAHYGKTRWWIGADWAFTIAFKVAGNIGPLFRGFSRQTFEWVRIGFAQRSPHSLNSLFSYFIWRTGVCLTLPCLASFHLCLNNEYSTLHRGKMAITSAFRLHVNGVWFFFHLEWPNSICSSFVWRCRMAS